MQDRRVAALAHTERHLLLSLPVIGLDHHSQLAEEGGDRLLLVRSAGGSATTCGSTFRGRLSERADASLDARPGPLLQNRPGEAGLEGGS